MCLRLFYNALGGPHRALYAVIHFTRRLRGQAGGGRSRLTNGSRGSVMRASEEIPTFHFHLILGAFIAEPSLIPAALHPRN